MNLYHYYDAKRGPFLNLSDLSDEAANCIMGEIRMQQPQTQCAVRDAAYMFRRRMYEDILRKEFIKKGGRVERQAPHYMVVEASPWLSSWFDNSAFIRIPIEAFDVQTISFTYGDSHPTFSPWPREDDWKEYRRQLYTYTEILGLIEKYGLPQEWNDDGRNGPERYIEAHVWSDATIEQFVKNLEIKC